MYRQPYTDKALVVNASGNKCTLQTKEGKILDNIHLEDVLLVPTTARSLNVEKEPLRFEEEQCIDLDTKRSPGMMLEDDVQRRPERERCNTRIGVKVEYGMIVQDIKDA